MLISPDQDLLSIIYDLNVRNTEQIISREELSCLFLIMSEVEIKLSRKFRNYLL